METVGDRVRRYRRLWRGPGGERLTQEALADMAGVDRRYLGRIETGEVQQPGVETIVKIARALRQPIRALADPGWYEGTDDEVAVVRATADDRKIPLTEAERAILRAAADMVEEAKRRAV